LEDKKNNFLYEVYDINERYLGKISLTSDDQNIVDVYQDLVYMLEKTGDGSYHCRIYQLIY